MNDDANLNAEQVDYVGDIDDSDDESWYNHVHKNHDNSDPIEILKTEPHDGPALCFQKISLSRTTVSGNGDAIITKFRRYDRKDSTSEAGFSDGYDNSSNDLWQTNQRIVNQPRDGDDNNAFVDLQLSQNRPTNPQTTERGSSEDEYQPISALKGKAPLLAKRCLEECYHFDVAKKRETRVTTNAPVASVGSSVGMSALNNKSYSARRKVCRARMVAMRSLVQFGIG